MNKITKERLKEITDQFDQIILNKATDKLLVFLQVNSKGVVAELKKHLKKVNKYWLEHINLSNEPEFKRNGWGHRADDEQEKILILLLYLISLK